MLNLVVPMAGSQTAFNESRYGYSKNLIEVQGKPLIEHIYGKLRTLAPKRVTFIVGRDECTRFHLDDVIRLLEPEAHVVVTDGETGGAACSALLAIDRIPRDEPLVIANGDQVIHRGLQEAIHSFQFSDLDGGVVVFPSIHPRWSYVRLDKNGLVTEAAEKRPISRHATAGVYYYRRGGDFIDAAMDMIRKDAAVNGQFYICPAFNEMVLANRRIGVFNIDRDLYFSLSTPNGVGGYERFLFASQAREHRRTMKVGHLRDMQGGWYVGNFAPSVLQTEACEVGLKTYRAGEVSPRHYHKLATETTLIVSGQAEMNGVLYEAGDIIVVEPEERSDFKAITDVVVAVVKIPGAQSDKYTD